MKNINSLKNTSQFKEVYSNGNSSANRFLVFYVLKNELEITRLGISVSKKVGNSVVRHRVARLIRESYRANRNSISGGVDIVVVARPAAAYCGLSEIESAFNHMCRMQKLV